MADDNEAFLATLGQRVRVARARAGLSRRELAVAAGISERYLAALEAGTGNISVLLLRNVARALALQTSVLLDEAADDGSKRSRRIALIGLRGAGKSTLGERLAVQLAVPFIELDREIERESGLTLAAIFDIYGQPGFRRLERRCLEHALATHERFVLAAGGSIVAEEATFARLREACYTVWLRALPEEHMARVVAQGDLRPMADNGEAMADLRRILDGRSALYARADARLETSGHTIDHAFASLRDLTKF